MEVFDEPRIPVHKGAIYFPAVTPDLVHDSRPPGFAGVRAAWQGGRERHGAHRLLERAHGDAAQPVLRVNSLALLRDPETSPHRSRRRAENGARDPAAAAADRPAAAVKEGQIDTGPLDRLDERRLRALQRPARRADPRVLVAVGVSDHHHLVHAALGEMGSVIRIVEQRTHDVGRAFEIGHGFEQRRDVQRDMFRSWLR